MRELVVGTRGSKLALVETHWVVQQLEQAGIPNPIRVKEIKTKGDKKLYVSLPELGGGGAFLAEIEHELLEGEIDFVDHRLKDIPVQLLEGLTITSIPEREHAGDVLLNKTKQTLAELPEGAVIGTSSLRRVAQLLRVRPDLQTNWIRGPIDSRIEQMKEGKFDAIILAKAGFNRLNIGQDFIAEQLPVETFVPAMGQGALAIECRANDVDSRYILSKINDDVTEKAVMAERKIG